MNNVSAAVRFAISTLALCSLTGCGSPPPELVAADPVPEQDVWIDQGSPLTVHTRDGMSVAGPEGFGQVSATARVPGGVWICSEDSGLAVYDEKSGAWTSYGWNAELPQEVRESCAFDARSVTEAWFLAPASDQSLKNYICHSGASGWSCSESQFYVPYSFKLTETKLWMLEYDYYDEMVVVMDATAEKGADEAGAKQFSVAEEYLWGGLERVPGAEAMFAWNQEHLLQFDGESVKEIDSHSPYGSRGGFHPVALGLDHYYSVASAADVSDSCDGKILHYNCHSRVANWSEVTVLELEGDDATALGMHREEGVEWFATGVLQDGELRVNAGGWYGLP